MEEAGVQPAGAEQTPPFASTHTPAKDSFVILGSHLIKNPNGRAEHPVRFTGRTIRIRRQPRRARLRAHERRDSPAILAYLMREAIRGHQRPSEAIRGQPRPSEVIRGHLMHSRTSKMNTIVHASVLNMQNHGL